MFNSPILEVAISLVFVYLLFSLLTRAAKEMIAGLINLRGVFLVKGIQSIIGDMTSTYKIALPDKYESFVQAAANTTLAMTNHNPGALAQQFFRSPSIQRLFGNRFLIGTDRTPSYI